MHDAILTTMDKADIPRVEKAVRLIAGSTDHGPNSEIQNPDRREFLGNLRTRHSAYVGLKPAGFRQ